MVELMDPENSLTCLISSCSRMYTQSDKKEITMEAMVKSLNAALTVMYRQ